MNGTLSLEILGGVEAFSASLPVVFWQCGNFAVGGHFVFDTRLDHFLRVKQPVNVSFDLQVFVFYDLFYGFAGFGRGLCYL